jgi:uncharacterized membrane protein YbhN (UPF0104 family)
LAAVVLVVLRIGELGRFAELARAARPAWLIAAVGLQVLTYVCAAAVWHAALRHVGAARRLRALIPLGIAKLFTDQALPSGGISGTMLVIGGLKRRGVPGPLAMAALLVGLVSFYAAYGLAALAGLAILQFQQDVGPATIVIAIVFAMFVVGVPAAVLSARWLPDHPWLQPLRRIPGVASLLEAVASAPADPLRDPLLMSKATGLQLAVFVLDAATLYVMLRAVGQPASPLAAFASFVVADVVATVGPTPLGLGVFEGTAVTVLHLTGVPLEVALAATLLLRGFTFWLPMVPGIWLARRELM